MKQGLMGPIVWEQHRKKIDENFVETNLHLAMLNSHSNSSTLTSIDAGTAVEQYEIDYMVKDQSGGLDRATSTMLAAMNYLEENKSQAIDAETDERKSKFFAQRTINAFHGGTEYEMRTMIAALLGQKSVMSSEKFRYIFPWDLIAFLNKNIKCKQDDIENENNKLIEEINNENILNINDAINEIDTLLEEEDIECEKENKGKSSTMYKVNNNTTIFLTQVESYLNRGIHFEKYSPLEFESIVDIKKNIIEGNIKDNDSWKRQKRIGFELGKNHPLNKYGYKGYIRAKFCTLMFEGPSILESFQKINKNKEKGNE